MSTPAMIVAIVVLVGFGGLLYYLFSISSAANETLWNRAIFLYGGVEALAFAAAGYLFGKEVHRQQAENAEKRADEKTKDVERETKKAATAEANGQSLAKAIAVKRGSATSAKSRLEGLGRSEGQAGDLLANGSLEELDQLARQLFPH
jgi:hypothetical protein